MGRLASLIEKQVYARKKETGEHWLGEIPEHWELLKLKHIFKEKKIVHNPSLNCGAISFGRVITKDDDKIPISTKASYQEVLSGEYLVNPLNLNYDLKSLRIALSDIDVVVSSGYIVLKNRIKINKSYYKWLLHRYDVAYMKLLGSGVRQTINFNHISNSILPYPPIEEQNAIAIYLDAKTIKIDEAIAQKERLIKLLKERKQIIIQNAVTKGLDPNVKFKDSGIEWIGNIPEHWEKKRFRFVFTLSKGLTITKENLKDEGVYCVNYGEIHSKYGFEVNPEIHSLKCVDEEYVEKNKDALIKKGDFVFADTSEDIEGSGNFTYLNSNKMVFAGYHTVTAKPKGVINSRFLAYEFDSISFRNQIRFRVKGVKVYSITQSLLKEPTIWIPTIEEQEAIVEYLDSELKGIENAINLQVKLIERLKEYRTSLIDNVVTGKIKVS